MAKYISLLNRYKADIGIILLALGIHLWYLFHTTFVDWPEMLLYPWLHSQGLAFYRDIIIPFPPAINYFLYAMYSFFGYSAASQRIIAYLCIFLTDILIYVVVRVLVKRRMVAWSSMLFFIFWQPIFYGNSLWHETILAPIIVGTFLAVVQYLKGPTLQRAVWIGILFALLSLSKQTTLWSMAIVCLYILVVAKDKRLGIRDVLIVGIFPVAAHLMVYGYYLLIGVGAQYAFWVYRFPFLLADKGSYYRLDPTRGDIALLLPAFIPLMVAVLVSRNRNIFWLLSVWTVALVAMAFPRWAIHRLQPALAFAAIGFAMLVSGLAEVKSKTAVLLGSIVLVLVASFGWRSIRAYTTIRDPMQPQFFGEMYQELVAFGNQHLDQPFFILGDYDYLYIGLDKKPVVLPWMQLLPWNAQLPGMQERIITSLESQKVPYILYIPYHPKEGYYLNYPPNELLLYVRTKYVKIGAMPVEGGELYKRR